MKEAKRFEKRPGARREKGHSRGFSPEEKTCERHLTRAERRSERLHWLRQGRKGGCADCLIRDG